MPMKSALLLLAVAVSANSHVHPQTDLEGLAKDFPEFRRGLLRYGHHLRHHNGKNRHAALLKHAHNTNHRYLASLDAELEGDAQDEPMRLPGRHPSVEKALDGMSDDLAGLKETKMAAKETRAKLEGSVSDTMQHMNDAMSIKHAMAKKESQLRIENGKLEVLEKDAGRLDETHNSLVDSLHRMLEPKIMLARERYAKKEKVWKKEEEAAHAWKERQDRLKDSAMDLIKKKKASYQSLLEAEAEVARAQKKQELARIQYEHDRAKTAEEVQSYRYAETRYKAELQHEQAAKKAALATRESAEKMLDVERVEQEKVDRSIMYRKEKLRRRIMAEQEKREKSKGELDGLAREYQEWKEKQRERTAEVVKKAQETTAASDAFQARQQKVLDNASKKVVAEAEAAGDWDNWGAESFKVGDDDDDDN